MPEPTWEAIVGSKPQGSGVYALICLPEQKAYIGSSVDLAARKSQHFSDLRSGTHLSPSVQADFDKHGESAFIFLVLRECEFERLNTVERDYVLNKNGLFPAGTYNRYPPRKGGRTFRPERSRPVFVRAKP